METARKDNLKMDNGSEVVKEGTGKPLRGTHSKRIYTKHTPDQRKALLTARLATLKAAHETRAKLIERLEAKVNGTALRPA